MNISSSELVQQEKTHLKQKIDKIGSYVFSHSLKAFLTKCSNSIAFIKY